MKLHGIQTLIGAAILADLSYFPHHPVDIAPAWGLILWGRCDRPTFGIIACNSKADWIADYSPSNKCAIVIFTNRSDVKFGDQVNFDSACVDAICPSCGLAHYISSGINWRCKNCDRQWRRNPGKRGRPRKN
jgi:hypothetical protein